MCFVSGMSIMSMKRNANLHTTVKPLLNSELLINYDKKVLISFSWKI